MNMPSEKVSEGKLADAAAEAKRVRQEVKAAAAAIYDLQQQYLVASKDMNHVEDSIELALTLVEMRKHVRTCMPLLRALYNTQLGFKCDRPNDKNRTPYDDHELGEAAIVALLRGVRWTGNMFNIIAGGCYITKEGFQYKLGTLDGLENFRYGFGVPMLKAGGALVKTFATWTFKGKPDKVETEFAVRVNSGSGEDMALGKAKRKLYAYVWDMLTGFALPDGDVDDAAALTASRTDAVAERLGIEAPKERPVDVAADIAAATKDKEPVPAAGFKPIPEAEAKRETAPLTADIEERCATCGAVECICEEAGPVKPIPPDPQFTLPPPNGDTLLKFLHDMTNLGANPWDWLKIHNINDVPELAAVKNKRRSDLATAAAARVQDLSQKKR